MKHSKIGNFLLLAMMISVLVLSSCKELTNEKDSSNSISVDLNDIKQQLNESRSSQSISGSGGAKTLVIGAIVVSRSTPYTTGELSSFEEDELVEDLVNSINYITLVELPVAKDYVEFQIPPNTAGYWQVVVVAVNFDVNTLGDLDDYESDGGDITHTGFTPQFYTSGNVGSGVIPITMVTYD
jgi:hypothetical protein